MTLLLSKVEKTIRVTRRREVDKIYSQETCQRLNSADHWPRSIKVILLQAQIRFGAELPADLETRLNKLNLEQLTALVTAIATANNLQEWLAGFPKN
jgi:hypothetical protein